MKKLVFAGLGVAALFVADASRATVIHSLPTVTPTDWSRGSFDSFSAGTTAQGETALQTAPYRGVYYGWQEAAGAPSGWTPGDSTDGNYLSITARFGSNVYGGPKDWTAYFYDGANFAYMRFNPTRCDYTAGPCYDAPAMNGVDVYFADALNNLTPTFVPIDTSVDHTYEFLLKNGVVSYRIGGTALTGLAYDIPLYKLLIIGDESNPTPLTLGTMTIRDTLFDTAPVADVLLSNGVPEPASWALMLGGFGLLGATVRRRRVAAIA